MGTVQESWHDGAHWDYTPATPRAAVKLFTLALTTPFAGGPERITLPQTVATVRMESI
jgi:hypothetical protein